MQSAGSCCKDNKRLRSPEALSWGRQAAEAVLDGVPSHHNSLCRGHQNRRVGRVHNRVPCDGDPIMVQILPRAQIAATDQADENPPVTRLHIVVRDL